MATSVIVSYDGTTHDDDALALARMLLAGGARLSLAYVRHSREYDPRREEIGVFDADRREDQDDLGGWRFQRRRPANRGVAGAGARRRGHRGWRQRRPDPGRFPEQRTGRQDRPWWVHASPARLRARLSDRAAARRAP